MKPGPQLDVHLPSGGAEGHGAPHGPAWPIESCQHAVPCGFNYGSTILFDHPLRQLIVSVE
jgi:hypothetical protein